MLKKSNSSMLICIINSCNNKSYKSCNDLVNLSNPSLCMNNNIQSNNNDKINTRKLVSYGEFLQTNPKATKKQRVQAIQKFYNDLMRTPF